MQGLKNEGEKKLIPVRGRKRDDDFYTLHSIYGKETNPRKGTETVISSFCVQFSMFYKEKKLIPVRGRKLVFTRFLTSLANLGGKETNPRKGTETSEYTLLSLSVLIHWKRN